MDPGAAERLAERLARLQAVTARLAAAREVGEIAAAICDHGAAGLGASAGAVMELADGGRRLRLVRQQGYAPESADQFRYFDVDLPTPFGEAVRSRNLVVIRDRDERDERFPILRNLPMRLATSVVAPLVADDRLLGALAFSFARERDLDAEDRRFVMAVAGQAAQALDRGRALDAERAAGRRQELLARTTGILGASLEPEAALAAVGRVCAAELCDFFLVTLGAEADVLVAAHADPAVEERLQSTMSHAGYALAAALTRAVADGGVLAIPDVPERWWEGIVDAGPEVDELLERAALGSVVAVGLAAGGEQLGALCLVRRRGREPFGDGDEVLASELASRIGFAVENARLHRAAKEVARTLQSGLLPPRLPDIPGVTLASRYAPVGDGSIVGGDFYDVFPIAGDRWGVVLGDVCGQGVRAAALTAQVRYTVRAAARLARTPSEALRFTNDALLESDLDERFCTVLLGFLQLRPHGVALTLAAAGHHLPLHLPAGQPPRPVGKLGGALGLVPDVDLVDTTVALAPGDLLVLYTDGVVEARGPQGHVGDRFLDELVAAHGPEGAEAVAAAIESAVLTVGEGRTHDDVAVLVLEAVGDRPEVEEAPADGSFDQRYPSDPAAVGHARRAMTAWLAGQGLAPIVVNDLVLAVAELVTNAVRAARTAVEVRAWTVPEGIVVEVTDDGPGFDDAEHHPRQLDPLAERGRGLFLVHALVDDCTIETGPNGSIVRCFVAR